MADKFPSFVFGHRTRQFLNKPRLASNATVEFMSENSLPSNDFRSSDNIVFWFFYSNSLFQLRWILKFVTIYRGRFVVNLFGTICASNEEIGYVVKAKKKKKKRMLISYEELFDSLLKQSLTMACYNLFLWYREVFHLYLISHKLYTWPNGWNITWKRKKVNSTRNEENK